MVPARNHSPPASLHPLISGSLGVSQMSSGIVSCVLLCFSHAVVCPCFLLRAVSSENRLAGTESCSMNMHWDAEQVKSLWRDMPKNVPNAGSLSEDSSYRSPHALPPGLSALCWGCFTPRGEGCFLAPATPCPPNTGAPLSRSSRLLEAPSKHVLWLLPAVPSSPDSDIRLGTMSGTDTMMSPPVLCPVFSSLQTFSCKWHLVRREKRNYINATQQIGLEGLSSGKNHLSGVFCLKNARESVRTVILYSFFWLSLGGSGRRCSIRAVLASSHFC